MGKVRRIPCGEHEHASPSCPLNPRRGHLHSCAAPAALAADLEVKVCQPLLLPSRLSLSWRLSLPGRLRVCAAGSLGTWDPSRGRRSRLPLLPAARCLLEAGAGEVTVKAFVCTWIQRSKDFPRRCVWPFGGAFFLFNSFFFPNSSLFMVTLAGVFSLCYPPVALVVTAPCHHPPPIFWVVPGLAFMYGFNKPGVLLKP